MSEDVKLTKLAACAGCGAKVGAGELAKLFEGFEQPRDPNLLVGFDRADDAAVYRVSDDVALVQTLDSSRPSPMTPSCSARSPPRTRCPTSTPWEGSPRRHSTS